MVVRTDEATKLDIVVCGGASVAFEIDGAEEATRKHDVFVRDRKP